MWGRAGALIIGRNAGFAGTERVPTRAFERAEAVMEDLAFLPRDACFSGGGMPRSARFSMSMSLFALFFWSLASHHALSSFNCEGHDGFVGQDNPLECLVGQDNPWTIPGVSPAWA